MKTWLVGFISGVKKESGWGGVDLATFSTPGYFGPKGVTFQPAYCATF